MSDPASSFLGSNSEKSGAPASSRKALVFDDQPEIGALAVIRLTRLGFDARKVFAKPLFLATVGSWQPDLILLDLSLGDSDAIELFALLKEQKFRGHVILMSGHPRSVLDHARQVGENMGIAIAGVLRKPFIQRDLSALVADLNTVVQRPPSVHPDNANLNLLRDALNHGWLEFWYQPKIDLRTDLIVGAECLARISHPQRGVLAPGAFLKDAADQELYELTTKALDDACQRAGTRQKRGSPLTFSINVAARSFLRKGFLDEFIAIRERHSKNLPIILEVTETDLVDDKIAVQAFATRAVLNGFRISIDDFGHGYATFERLRDMPFTELKLERSMVEGCARDSALRSICKATVELAHGFGAAVIAEGVEREDDLKVVRSLGFDMAQGYYFSRPVPFEDFERLPVVQTMRSSSETGVLVRR
jgi:EAL domain-containing protein (putative c-di-GMP-specific phosphodiesterase class I)/FixJ family two-component response regulator